MNIKNMAHSIRQKLLDEAKKSGRPFQDLLTLYNIERFLYRLGQSRYVKQFYLKGALLFNIWGIPKTRPTADIDMLGKVDSADEILKSIMVECMLLKIDEDDGLEFHPKTITIEAITEDTDYQGKRIRFMATLDNAKTIVQVDVGIGDSVVPAPIWIDYPTIIEQQQPHLLAYTAESSIAEKFHAMVKRDMANSRMKDFYDIWLLSEHLDFKGEILSKAIRTTFERRGMPISDEIPTAFTDEFADDESHTKQWAAFLKKNELTEGTPIFKTIQKKISEFIMPIMMVLSQGDEFSPNWKAGQNWK